MLISWCIAAVALLVSVRELVRHERRSVSWSRASAWAFPLAAAFGVASGSLTPYLRGDWLSAAMLVRMTAFWAAVIVAPAAVGQVVGLRPPPWLLRAHAGLAGVYALLWFTTELVFPHPVAYDPVAVIGPLALPLLLPVAVSGGWWMLSTLQRAPSQSSLVLLAFGGSTTVLALLVAAIVVEPVLTDHFLSVAWLPVLLAATLVTAEQDWRSRAVRVRQPR